MRGWVDSEHDRIQLRRLPSFLLATGAILCGSCQGVAPSPGHGGGASTERADVSSERYVASHDSVKDRTRTFEVDQELPRPGLASDLYQLAMKWFSDTTFLSPVRLLNSLPDSLALIGTGSQLLHYQVGEGPNALKGYGELTYDIRVIAKDGGYSLRIDGARINGIPPQNDTCWIPCKTYEYPKDRTEGYSREYREAMWWQMCSGVETHLTNIPSLFMMWTMTHGGPPSNEKTR